MMTDAGARWDIIDGIGETISRLPCEPRQKDFIKLSRLPQQTDEIHNLLLQALRDPVEGVRWQAALVVPLLDDTTPIQYDRPSPGPEWRICDRAAVTIAVLLGWESPRSAASMRSDRREEITKRAREWAGKGP
jgi:hypothetical protein